jgi:hypothetical protein
MNPNDIKITGGFDANKYRAAIAAQQEAQAKASKATQTPQVKPIPSIGGAVTSSGIISQNGNTPITVDAFATDKFTVPSPVKDTTASDKLGATAAQATIAPPTAPKVEKSSSQILADRIGEIAGLQATQGDFTAQAQADAQLEEKTMQQAVLQERALETKKRYEDKIKRVRENVGGMSASQLENAISDLEFKANEDLANIGIQQQVALGNLEAARQIVKDKVDAKFEPLKNELATRIQQFNLLQNDMTESQQLEFQRNTAIQAATLKHQQDLELKRQEKELENGQKYTAKQLTAISKINQDVSKNATYLKTSNMRAFADNVSASLGLGTGAGDLAAINQFQKVVDEGAVTRDQDVKLIQSSQSLLNKLSTKVKGLATGEQLSSDIRQEMLQAVNALYDAQLKALGKDPYIMAKNKEAELYGLSAIDTILGEVQTITGTAEISPEKESLFDEIVSVEVTPATTPATTTPATNITTKETKKFPTLNERLGEYKNPFKF